MCSNVTKKMNSDRFWGSSKFFLCSSGTFSHVLSEWPNPWAPGSFALERSTDVGMKRWVEEPNHNSSIRSLPSAQCHVCSPHELGKMLPEHCSHPPRVILWISRCWTYAGDVTPAGAAGGLAESYRTLGLNLCLIQRQQPYRGKWCLVSLFACPLPGPSLKLRSWPGIKYKHTCEGSTA